ncbi:flagellar basal body rod protein FlgF [Sansalvadorimonas sp. 2012CJ34-2]|uniref:Flagellar basal-body rod protein FlgF n=1 Tax=Parendozoicomonas callyspongiae TaxID=2942213 RepID=A0ABT0PFF1_9GAMM|nr:flagellar basal body rod protein FlgF [Sansalvadorimonas sp. 2012CJ34-2]MCL6270102.1 flagellar basal body rod protein FlgF [Sansalvadorimonas sp. 2012CJ34-2]
MDKAIYTAMSGATRALFQQRQHSNNLANVNTTGYKADFADIMARNVKGEGLPTRVFTEVQGTWSDTSSGTMMSTGRELDVAVQDGGWLAVLDSSGKEAYTSSGQLSVTQEGLLITGRGQPVLGVDGAPLSVPEYEQLQIGPDGTISILGSGDPKSQTTTVGQLKLALSESRLEKGTDGLFRTKNNAPLPPSESVSVASGTLEGSNVNSVEEMASFMSLSRQFEMQLKTMETARQMAEAGDRLIRKG